MATDREICKGREAGVRATYGLANANGSFLETVEIHSRSHHIAKTSSEIANANVAEQAAFVVDRKSKIKTVKGCVGAGITQDTSHYVIVTLAKRTAGGAATTVATYNTHNSAQGTITAWSPFSFSVVANSDSTLADGDAVTLTVTKIGNGAALNISSFSVDVEEV